MQAIMETLFDAVYLVTVVLVGIIMIHKSNNRKQYRLFGIMAVVLGCGDAFHLIPRAYALCTSGLESQAAALGFGKFVTSITMTIFYILLYHIWSLRYQEKENKLLSYLIYALAAVRILLCFLPQNKWFKYNAPVQYGIYRNIPFAIIGIIMIVLFYQKAKEQKDKSFQFMWLAIVLSFGFYIPVVLFSTAYPIVGIFMIPKTLAYVWIVFMGYIDLKKQG